VEASLEVACAHVAEGLRRAAAKHGPESVAVFVSPEATNEEMVLAARIAREGLGTNNIGSLVVLETGGEAGALDAQLGFTASSAGREVLADADLVVCNNTATESDHLILAVAIARAVRRGARLVVANSILDKADQFLATVAMDPMRGRATHLWLAVLAELLERDAEVKAAAAKLSGGAAFVEGLRQDAPATAEASGVAAERIRKTAALLAESRRIVIVHCPDRPRTVRRGICRRWPTSSCC